MNTESNYPRSAVLENADLLRVIGEYLEGAQLPFILSFKRVREALKPRTLMDGQQWIKSKKKNFATSISIVEWAQTIGCKFDLTNFVYNLFLYTASQGSVDVLRWAHQKYPPDQYQAGVRFDVCIKAAENDHLPVLEYLRSLGSIVQWDRDVCCYTAFKGYLHILKWLREGLDPPCPWDYRTCNYAALAGHVHVLQWLGAHDAPCRWSKVNCYDVAYSGHLEVLKWLRAQDPPCPWTKKGCVNIAISQNQRKLLEWVLLQPE